MSHGVVTIAIGCYGERMNMIYCSLLERGLWNMGIPRNVRNGPPLVGRFSNCTWKETPIPLSFAVATTVPLILPLGSSGLKNSLVGRMAV